MENSRFLACFCPKKKIGLLIFQRRNGKQQVSSLLLSKNKKIRIVNRYFSVQKYMTFFPQQDQVETDHPNT
jgi:hypothetical protein